MNVVSQAVSTIDLVTSDDIVAAGAYVDGQRVVNFVIEELVSCVANPATWSGSGCANLTWHSSTPCSSNSSYTIWRSRMRTTPASGRNLNSMATRSIVARTAQLGMRWADLAISTRGVVMSG